MFQQETGDNVRKINLSPRAMYTEDMITAFPANSVEHV